MLTNRCEALVKQDHLPRSPNVAMTLGLVGLCRAAGRRNQTAPPDTSGRNLLVRQPDFPANILHSPIPAKEREFRSRESPAHPKRSSRSGTVQRLESPILVTQTGKY